jgi:hypothetical protein
MSGDGFFDRGSHSPFSFDRKRGKDLAITKWKDAGNVFGEIQKVGRLMNRCRAENNVLKPISRRWLQKKGQARHNGTRTYIIYTSQ